VEYLAEGAVFTLTPGPGHLHVACMSRPLGAIETSDRAPSPRRSRPADWGVFGAGVGTFVGIRAGPDYDFACFSMAWIDNEAGEAAHAASSVVPSRSRQAAAERRGRGRAENSLLDEAAIFGDLLGCRPRKESC
jgi:hypothetical protein